MISLASILNDSTSGSSELLQRLNQYFLQEIKNKIEFNPDIALIEKKLESFTNIKGYLLKVKEYVQGKDFYELENYLNNFDSAEKESLDKLFQNSRKLLPRFRTALTISNSRTLIEFFKYLNSHINKIEIFISESLPGGEGNIMAEILSKNGLNAKVIKDDEAEVFAKKSDVVFLGADKILEDGSIVNKIGSKNLSIVAKNRNIPVFVLATKNKFELVKNTESVYDKELFEIIESDLITKIITD